MNKRQITNQNSTVRTLDSIASFRCTCPLREGRQLNKKAAVPAKETAALSPHEAAEKRLWPGAQSRICKACAFQIARTLNMCNGCRQVFWLASYLKTAFPFTRPVFGKHRPAGEQWLKTSRGFPHWAGQTLTAARPSRIITAFPFAIPKLTPRGLQLELSLCQRANPILRSRVTADKHKKNFRTNFSVRRVK